MLEHQIFSFGKMILRDRCSASYDLASLFRGRHSNLDRWSRKKRKMHWYEAVSCALNFPFLKVSHIKNETILQDFLQKWKVECRADGLVPMRFAFFSTPPV